ncbi:hypothetical protein PBV87_11600 [Niameybacter massiliensis]|uniref:Uncharacterized protein n=1 Tax=Holtiella tumoricola TaxID=3018743 RepID=A0AA42DN73_9FIRM|nr:hypothetical protein [Holtiella tumoricola]MDA3732128.1 hypothetical protein [Holtiella tumoricola]
MIKSNDMQEVFQVLVKDGGLYNMTITQIIEEVLEGIGYVSEDMLKSSNDEDIEFVKAIRRELGEYLMKC